LCETATLQFAEGRSHLHLPSTKEKQKEKEKRKRKRAVTFRPELLVALRSLSFLVQHISLLRLQHNGSSAMVISGRTQQLVFVCPNTSVTHNAHA
jgi:hypothetical protein